MKKSDDGDCPPDGNTNMNILSSVCGDANDIKSDDDEEEISVNESIESNNNLPDDLLNALYGKSTHDDEGDDEDVQDGQQHRDKSRGLGERQDSDEDDEVEDEGIQDGQQHQDKSGGLGERQDSDEDDEVEDEGVQDGQQHQDTSGALGERQDSDEEDEVQDEGVQNRQQHRDKSGGLEDERDRDNKEQQDQSSGKTGEDSLSKSQRK